MRPNERVIKQATFNDDVTTYWLVSGIIVCLISVVGILFLPVWLLGGKRITRKYLASHECVLTNRSLKVRKGILIRTEKTVPLDRITDLGIVQGPVMRHFKIEALSVETAGQSTPGAAISLAGIDDGRDFRDLVLAQRDLVVGSSEDGAASPVAGLSGSEDSTMVELLTDIRNSLRRMEDKKG